MWTKFERSVSPSVVVVTCALRYVSCAVTEVDLADVIVRSSSCTVVVSLSLEKCCNKSVVAAHLNYRILVFARLRRWTSTFTVVALTLWGLLLVVFVRKLAQFMACFCGCRRSW